jgi:hypothetical protein
LDLSKIQQVLDQFLVNPRKVHTFKVTIIFYNFLDIFRFIILPVTGQVLSQLCQVAYSSQQQSTEHGHSDLQCQTPLLEPEWGII